MIHKPYRYYDMDDDYAPEAPPAIAAGLRQLATLSPGERRALGERGRAFVQAHHAYAVLARRFIEALA